MCPVLLGSLCILGLPRKKAPAPSLPVGRPPASGSDRCLGFAVCPAFLLCYLGDLLHVGPSANNVTGSYEQRGEARGSDWPGSRLGELEVGVGLKVGWVGTPVPHLSGASERQAQCTCLRRSLVFLPESFPVKACVLTLTSGRW